MGFADKNPRRLFPQIKKNGNAVVRHISPALELPTPGCSPNQDLFPLHQLPDGSWGCKHCRRKWTNKEVQDAIDHAPRIEDGVITINL